MTNFDNIPGTWACELKQHFLAFSHACWIGFNNACEDMRKNSHENEVDRIKWREYVLLDMQKNF